MSVDGMLAHVRVPEDFLTQYGLGGPGEAMASAYVSLFVLNATGRAVLDDIVSATGVMQQAFISGENTEMASQRDGLRLGGLQILWVIKIGVENERARRERGTGNVGGGDGSDGDN